MWLPLCTLWSIAWFRSSIGPGFRPTCRRCHRDRWAYAISTIALRLREYERNDTRISTNHLAKMNHNFVINVLNWISKITESSKKLPQTINLSRPKKLWTSFLNAIFKFRLSHSLSHVLMTVACGHSCWMGSFSEAQACGSIQSGCMYWSTLE